MPATLESAAARIAAQDWAGATRIYKQITEAEPGNAAGWYGLASGLFQTQQFAESVPAFEKALELGYNPQRTMLLLARAHANSRNDAEAFQWIAKAAEVGDGVYEAVTNTPDFQRFFGVDGFQDLLQKIAPCNGPEHKILDFWLGSWRVVVGENQQTVGKNSIFKVLNGCTVIENWQGASGSEGKSLFYYHDVDKQWKQVWVTSSGQVKEKRLIAVLDGAVRFQGELRQPDGRVILDRTTLIPLEEYRVRQVIEQSIDGGESWRATFDALYIAE